MKSSCFSVFAVILFLTSLSAGRSRALDFTFSHKTVEDSHAVDHLVERNNCIDLKVDLGKPDSSNPTADAPADKPELTVEERLLRINLSIVMRQFEKVGQMLADDQLSLAILNIQPAPSAEEQRKTLTLRIDFLHDTSDKLRRTAIAIEKEILQRKRELIQPAPAKPEQ